MYIHGGDIQTNTPLAHGLMENTQMVHRFVMRIKTVKAKLDATNAHHTPEDEDTATGHHQPFTEKGRARGGRWSEV